MSQLIQNAGIAQLVEHNLAKVGVASSSLVSRSRFLWLNGRVVMQRFAKPCTSVQFRFQPISTYHMPGWRNW